MKPSGTDGKNPKDDFTSAEASKHCESCDDGNHLADIVGRCQHCGRYGPDPKEKVHAEGHTNDAERGVFWASWADELLAQPDCDEVTDEELVTTLEKALIDYREKHAEVLYRCPVCADEVEYEPDSGGGWICPVCLHKGTWTEEEAEAHKEKRH